MNTTENNELVPTQFYYKKSRIHQLKGFCETVKEGTSIKAGEKLNLDASTISVQIKSLENDLGIKLFTRTPSHRLVLTKKGREFYSIAIVQLQGMDSLFARFHSKLKDTNKNTIVIAGYYTALSYILPEYIKRLVDNEEFKNIKIKLCNIDKEEAFKRLVDNEVDFAFYPSSDNDTMTPVEIDKQNIFKLKNAIYMSKQHPLSSKSTITKEDIEKHDYLLKDKYSFCDFKALINFKPSNITVENQTTSIMFGLVKKNLTMGGAGELPIFETHKNNDIIQKDVTHLLPTMFYSLYTLKNKQEKASSLFIINELKKDSDIN